MKACGHRVESTCHVLRQQGVAVAPRSYRAWKRRAPSARTINDAALVAVLRGLQGRDGRGPQCPEVLYGRRKMTAWLARSGFPDVSEHTVDRLMRDEGMCGLVRGRKTVTTIPAKNGIRAGDMLNRQFTAPRPNHTWVTVVTLTKKASMSTMTAGLPRSSSRRAVRTNGHVLHRGRGRSPIRA
ncbi:MAG: IS3 family transposase [Lacisediminihabitans sp.]